MTRFTDSKYNQFCQTSFVVVNGVQMSIADFKAMQKAKKAKKTRAKKAQTSITILPSEIKAMMKNVKVIKSLIAYREHGYKQWGTIARQLMGLKQINLPLHNVVMGGREAIALVEDIEAIAKKNDKDAFQFVKKLEWKLGEVKVDLNELVDGISSSGVISQFKNHECINGVGKRLGLKVLTERSYKAVNELEVICAKLNTIEKNGMNIAEYQVNGKQVK